MSIISPPTVSRITKHIAPTGLHATTLANGTLVFANDATVDELVIDVDATGAALSCLIEYQFQIPDDFIAFAGLADDLIVQAIQDGVAIDAVGDVAITVVVLDTSGTVVDDGSIADVALTAAYVQYDCPLTTGGTFVAGDFIVVQVTIAAKGGLANEAADGARCTVPKIKYIAENILYS